MFAPVVAQGPRHHDVGFTSAKSPVHASSEPCEQDVPRAVHLACKGRRAVERRPDDFCWHKTLGVGELSSRPPRTPHQRSARDGTRKEPEAVPGLALGPTRKAERGWVMHEAAIVGDRRYSIIEQDWCWYGDIERCGSRLGNRQFTIAEYDAAGISSNPELSLQWGWRQQGDFDRALQHASEQPAGVAAVARGRRPLKAPRNDDT
jgi:hypothetical protein